MSSEKLFEIGGIWIAQIEGRPSLYRFWYDSGTREIKRRSLKTADLEEAKRLVAGEIVADRVSLPQDPDFVLLLAVLVHYYENHSDTCPSALAARRAGELVVQFLEQECGFGAEVKVAKFTKAFQARFAIWCVEKFGHSVSYISRNLSVISAAYQFGAKTIVRRTSCGELTETRLLRFAPEVCYDTKWLAEMTKRTEPKPRDYVPSYEDLASLLDMEGSETLRRYDIIALNTWARPEAIADLAVRAQVDFENGLIDLNPPGRKQNKKRRPLIKLTENLRGWLEHWGEDRPLSYRARKIAGKKPEKSRASVQDVKAQFTRRSTRWMLLKAGLSNEEIDLLFRQARSGNKIAMREALKKAETKGIKRITRYTLRHFMATRIRGLQEIRVDREQRSQWLGHGKRDATSWYETHDPEYLRECSRATSLVLEKLDGLTGRSLLPPTVRARKELAGLIPFTDRKSAA